MHHTETQRQRGFFSRFFPPEHDFEEMLLRQAEETRSGVDAFVTWISSGCMEPPARIREIERNVDRMRYEFEETLIDAFSTPFDRQDLYSLSRQMDYILNYASETAREMYAFGVGPDPAIEQMGGLLLEGTEGVVEVLRVMTTDEAEVATAIRRIRAILHALEDAYIDGLSILFQESDAMNALRRREVYHHLRDGGRALRGTVDVLHRAVVGLS